MGKFTGLLLASDFDDTLYDSHCRVPERNLRAIRYFIAQGGRFTVATGRAHRTFQPHYASVPINAPVVLSNGAAIYDFQADRMLQRQREKRQHEKNLRERKYKTVDLSALSSKTAHSM